MPKANQKSYLNLNGQPVDQAWEELYASVRHSSKARLIFTDRAALASGMLLGLWDSLIKESGEYQCAFNEYIHTNKEIILANVLDAFGAPVSGRCFIPDESLLDYWASSYQELELEIHKKLTSWGGESSLDVLPFILIILEEYANWAEAWSSDQRKSKYAYLDAVTVSPRQFMLRNHQKQN